MLTAGVLTDIYLSDLLFYFSEIILYIKNITKKYFYVCNILVKLSTNWYTKISCK